MKKTSKITAAILVLMLLLAQVVCVNAATGSISLSKVELSDGSLSVTTTEDLGDDTAKEYYLYIGGSKVETAESGSFDYELTKNYSDKTAIKVSVKTEAGRTYTTDTDYLDLNAPSISVSAKQSDLYVKTVTATVKAASGTTYGYTNKITSVKMGAYANKYSTAVSEETFNVGDGINCSMSIDVRPTDIAYVLVTAEDDKGLSREVWYTVGSNGSLNLGSDDSNNSEWTGIQSGSNSGSTSNGAGNIWTGYDDTTTGNGTITITEEPVEKTSTYYVICRTLNVRKGAGTSYGKAGKVYRGTALQVVEFTSNGWAKVKYDGGYAYVSEKYIAK